MRLSYLSFVVVVMYISFGFSLEFENSYSVAMKRFTDYLDSLPIIEAEDMEIVYAKRGSRYLRTEDNPLRFVTFSEYNDDNCSDTSIRDVFGQELNACIPLEGKKNTHWAWFTLTEKEDTLYIQQNYFSDDQCTKKTLSPRTMKLGQLDVCKSSESDYSHRFRVSTILPKQFAGPEKPGVAMVSYGRSEECDSNEEKNIAWVYWVPLKDCVKGQEDEEDGDEGLDHMYMSCDENSVSGWSFEGNEGICAGASTIRTMTAGVDTCQGPGPKWTNYKCM
jgi:hypothetical protein